MLCNRTILCESGAVMISSHLCDIEICFCVEMDNRNYGIYDLGVWKPQECVRWQNLYFRGINHEITIQIFNYYAITVALIYIRYGIPNKENSDSFVIRRWSVFLQFSTHSRQPDLWLLFMDPCDYICGDFTTLMFLANVLVWRSQAMPNTILIKTSKRNFHKQFINTKNIRKCLK